MTVTKTVTKSAIGEQSAPTLVLAEQIIHRLRRAHQRACAIFADMIGDFQITPTQWAALVTLRNEGALSQNQLGRLTFMDPATTQGVTMRLLERGLVERNPDPKDRRRTSVSLTRAGADLVARLEADALSANEKSLAPLNATERAQLMALLTRIM